MKDFFKEGCVYICILASSMAICFSLSFLLNCGTIANYFTETLGAALWLSFIITGLWCCKNRKWRWRWEKSARV